MAKTPTAPVEGETDKSTEELQGAATKAHAEAVGNLDAAKAALADAGKAGDIDKMVEWAGKVKACEAQVLKTERAVKDAEFNRNSEARMTASLELKSAVEQFVAGFDMTPLYAVGLRGFSVTFNEDGSTNTNVQGMQAPSRVNANNRNAPKREGSQGTARSLWIYGGHGYTSKELLLEFGGEKGRIAVARTRPVSEEPEYGYDINKLTKNGQPERNPGFDTEVKTLAKRMGWDGGEERNLTHEPTE